MLGPRSLLWVKGGRQGVRGAELSAGGAVHAAPVALHMGPSPACSQWGSTCHTANCAHILAWCCSAPPAASSGIWGWSPTCLPGVVQRRRLTLQPGSKISMKEEELLLEVWDTKQHLAGCSRIRNSLPDTAPAPAPPRGTLASAPGKVAGSSSQSPSTRAGATWLKLFTCPSRTVWCGMAQCSRSSFQRAVPGAAATG